MTLRLTDAAEADLAEIWASIASNASEAAADRILSAVQTALEPIRHFPMAAPSRDQLARGLRVVFHSPYAIYYRPEADAVVVIRVLHGARDVAAIVEHHGFVKRS